MSLPRREAIHTILHAITNSNYLLQHMILKGGILLSLRHQCTRFTEDIDFSTSKKYAKEDKQKMIDELEQSLAYSVEDLKYGLDCRVQSCHLQPANQSNPTYPSLKIKIGYAYKGCREHKRLVKKNASSVIDIDLNYNELLPHIEKITLSEKNDIFAYSINDLIAEKFRAILQQEMRKRTRRQDIYDLFFLFQTNPTIHYIDKVEILETLRLKAESRNISINRESMKNTIIRERSKKYYNTLTDEIDGVLPDFDMAYNSVQQFYESLPW